MRVRRTSPPDWTTRVARAQSQRPCVTAPSGLRPRRSACSQSRLPRSLRCFEPVPSPFGSQHQPLVVGATALAARHRTYYASPTRQRAAQFTITGGRPRCVPGRRHRLPEVMPLVTPNEQRIATPLDDRTKARPRIGSVAHPAVWGGASQACGRAFWERAQPVVGCRSASEEALPNRLAPVGTDAVVSARRPGQAHPQHDVVSRASLEPTGYAVRVFDERAHWQRRLPGRRTTEPVLRR